MDKKELHLISNAHIDPMWQWEWEEGAAEALSTFRVAAKFCREFDSYIFCHNEAILYMWVEEYEPALFCEIQELVKLGKWHIMGGWHLQPDCNMPSGEGFVRNIGYGRRYFKEKFDVEPTTAINFDPFGHTRGLVQILAKSGFDSYMFVRPSQNDCPLPADVFTWVGYDGSTVTGARSPVGYNSPRGNAVGKVDNHVKEQTERQLPVHICLWGVGNHGGGPSFKDIRDINEKLDVWAREDGVTVIHSTPEDYFAAVRESGMELPEHHGDLNTWAPGCYTSQVRIKQKYRRIENELFVCEKMCAQLAATTDFAYPERELGEVLYDMLTIQFHDAIPGSSIQPVEEMCVRMLDHGLEILSRIKARAFFRLSACEKPAADGEIPIIAYNPHPYPVEGDFECEFMLADQNWKGTFTVGDVYSGDTCLPTQVEKENSNIPLDWRKRVAFHATLPPMQVSRFDCKLYEIERKPTPTPTLGGDDSHFVFDHGGMQVRISKTTGLIDSVVADGRSYLSEGALSIDVFADDEDPWTMNSLSWNNRIGRFTLLSPEEGTQFSALDNVIPSVRIVEDGAVRTVVEAVFGYETSKAVVRYKLSKLRHSIDVNVRIDNSCKKKFYKLAIPCLHTPDAIVSDVAFGEEPTKARWRENVQQRYIRAEQGQDRDLDINIYNRGSYGYSVDEKTVLVSLMRAPAYLAHPLGPLKPLPQDRYSPYIEQGERLFDLCLTFGRENTSNAIAAQGYNESPMVLSFFPAGTDGCTPAPALVKLEGDTVVMSALKKSDTCEGAWTVRLFNPTPDAATCRLISAPMGVDAPVTFTKYEIKTFLLSDGKLVETNLLERPV